MRRPVLTTLLILAAALVAFGIFVDRRADLREARIEAQYPPQGDIITVNGSDVHVVVKGSGPDLVLIHGAGGSTRDFPPEFVEPLAENYRVFIVDRPGFGWSGRMGPVFESAWTTRAETPREQARHLAEAVAQLGATRPLVVGHSYGAAVAMAWALEHDATAAVTVLSGATMPWPGEVDWTYRLLGSAAGGALLAPLVSAFLPENYVRDTLQNVFDPQSPPDDYYSRAGVMMAVRLQTLRANNRQVNTLRPQVVEMALEYPEVSIPVEIIHGTADETVFLTVHGEPLERTLPNANLTVLNGVGHMPQHVAIDDAIAAIHRAAERSGLR